jgi:regulator of protease activity HflC (stomatin/prohibitin superfamily)
MWVYLLIGGRPFSSVKIIQQGNEALVERLGGFDRKAAVTDSAL